MNSSVSMSPILNISLLTILLPGFCQASETCLPCHQKQVTGFKTTGMGRSASIYTPLPNGEIGKGALKIQTRQGKLHVSTGSESFPVAYTIGSGNEGISFLINSNQHLFQAPPSWYSTKNHYDLSPGFERDTHWTFDRAISSDCLFCHTGKSAPVQGTLNRYGTPAIPEISITCGRCHGSSEAHLRAPKRGNILNPQKLDFAKRDSICEQCHLGGEARILNPGKQFEDFRPGMLLEDVFSVYVGKGASRDSLKVVGHAEGLAASACAQSSQRKLWCASCHDVHQTPPNQKQWHREKCLACHAETTLTRHPAEKEDCAGCHMPRKQSFDGSHTAFTDHRIQIPGRKATDATAAEKLEAWRQPHLALRDRNLGLAYISVAEKELSPAKFNEGLRLLLNEQKNFPNDPVISNSIGAVLMKKNAASHAIQFFRKAIQSEPKRGINHLNLAAAFFALNRKEEARQSAEEALRFDAGLDEAYRLLILLEPEKKSDILHRFSQALPGRKLIVP